MYAFLNAKLREEREVFLLEFKFASKKAHAFISRYSKQKKPSGGKKKAEKASLSSIFNISPNTLILLRMAMTVRVMA